MNRSLFSSLTALKLLTSQMSPISIQISNTLTMIATYFAFGMNPSMMWTRTAATLGIAVAIGWVLLTIESKRRKLSPRERDELPMLEIAATGTPAPRRTVLQVLGAVIEHAVIEFFEVGGFVIISAAVATLLQTVVPISIISPIGQHPVWSVLAMMGLASLLSLCPEADAFVARSLAGLTTSGGVLGFLVIGQMIDMRNIFLFPHSAVKIAFCLAIVLPLCVSIWMNYR
ncbi:permease [Effusibacillus dendaii]|nr:permease [Effusibacillus dendaii]